MTWLHRPTKNNVTLIRGFIVALMIAACSASAAWSAERYGDVFGGLFPLGEATPPPLFPDKPIPFKTIGDLPARPALGIELGDPFLDTGKLDPGFETFWGAVWQPSVLGLQDLAHRAAVLR